MVQHIFWFIVLTSCLTKMTVWSMSLTPHLKDSLADSLSYIDDESDVEQLPGLIQILAKIMQQKSELTTEDNPSSSQDQGTDRDVLARLIDKMDRPTTLQQRRHSEVNRNKRIGDEEYGAMPPMNEFCRILKVRCG